MKDKKRFFLLPRPSAVKQDGRHKQRSNRGRVRDTLRRVQIGELELDDDETSNLANDSLPVDPNHFGAEVDIFHLEVWLNTRLDRPWRQVRDELRRRCGGDELVLEQADDMVSGRIRRTGWDDKIEWHTPFLVDSNGHLVRNQQHRRRKPMLGNNRYSDKREQQIKGWLNNRILIERSGKLYWGVMSGTRRYLTQESSHWDGTKSCSTWLQRGFSGFRQDRQLNNSEMGFFLSLTVAEQEQLLQESSRRQKNAKSWAGTTAA